MSTSQSNRKTVNFAEIPYEEQLRGKQARAEKLLGRFGKVEPILPMDEPLHYRCKVHAVFGRDARGRVLCGTYKEGTHKIIEEKDSPIENETAQRIIRTIKHLVISYKVRIYDEDLRTGLLRHVVVRCAKNTGEIMVIIVAASFSFPSINNIVKSLREAHPEITTIVLNVNDRRTNIVLGTKEKVLFGKGYIREELGGCTFRISGQSFFQVSPSQAEKLFETAIAFADLKEGERALDAYCGTGTIGILAAKSAGLSSVTGVERNAEAVADARRNAKENGLANISFITADSADFLERLCTKKKPAAAGRSKMTEHHSALRNTAKIPEVGNGQDQGQFDVVFMDPPREGASERFLTACVRSAPSRIVYVSCEPETLARDLRYLTKHGYKVRKMQPVDMFPFTEKTEISCLLERI